MSGSAHGPLAIDALRRARAEARIGKVIHYFDSVDSTNTVAHRLAAGDAVEGTVVIAETQTKGRGRLGRTWISPPFRNLYASIVLRPPIAVGAAPQIALVAGVATVEAASEWTPRAALKWPNDVVADGRKLAGILTELDAQDGRVGFVVLGIGVNLNSVADDFPPDLRDKAVGLCTLSGQPIDRVEFAGHLLARLEERYDLFVRAGFAAVRPLLQAQSCLTGKHVQIDGGDGRYAGVVTGIAEDGALLLRDQTGAEVRVVAGDVTVVDGYVESDRGPALNAKKGKS